MSLPTKGVMMKAYRVSYFEFSLMLGQARKESARIAEFTSEPDSLNPAGRYYLTSDAQSGFGVSPTGELVGLFTLVGGRGKALVAQSVQEGTTHGDCFDGFLPAYYASLGWVETSREPNWTPGGPDVVFFALPVTV